MNVVGVLDAVFESKYMLFDARPNVIRTFGLRIKQFLTASNISFSDILETPSYFVLPPWYIRPPKIVLDLMHLNIAQMRLFIRSFSWKCTRYRDYILVYTDGSRDAKYVACATDFPSNTIISMRLPHSASIFTAEIWATIKAL